MDFTDLQIVRAFESLGKMYSRGSYRAFHKPLLVLYMLGRSWRSKERLVFFREAHVSLRGLLSKFIWKPMLPESTMFPFWFMQTNKEIWELVDYEQLRVGTKKCPLIAEALASNLQGGFKDSLHKRIIHDKVFLLELVFVVLNKHFPKYMHIDLLEAVGIPNITSVAAMRSVMSVNQEVMKSYNNRCAVCEFSGEIDKQYIGIQVAYIKWPLAGGPYARDNGLVLCTQHRELFDCGAFTLSEDYNVRVSKKFKEHKCMLMLHDYNGQPVTIPASIHDHPNNEYVRWHNKYVFR